MRKLRIFSRFPSTIFKGRILHDRRVLFVQVVCQNLVFPSTPLPPPEIRLTPPIPIP